MLFVSVGFIVEVYCVFVFCEGVLDCLSLLPKFLYLLDDVDYVCVVLGVVVAFKVGCA